MAQKQDRFGQELSPEDKRLLDGEQKEKLRSLQDAAKKVGETIASSGNTMAAGALGALGGLGVGAALGSMFGGHNNNNNSGYSGDVGGVSDNTYTFSGDTGGGDFGGDGGDDGTFAGDS
ncbi:unnamed protein product [Phytophthora fragariaefolia]|uniref:Unnamed protein product n=1 Tax=Phytophthora fragariaefolia TaxID=1490495 RepID=A0A9W6XD76_9STRA|nr:unnamed protein product [Phytophthora fragariaefolia]